MRIRFLPLILCLAMVTSIGGAFAAWTFYSPPAPVTALLPAMLSPFAYAPEEVLPGQGEDGEGTGTVTPGENHLLLIQKILDRYLAGYGLNSGDDALLHKLLKTSHVVYCSQHTTGGNLKFYLDPKNVKDTYGLYYVMEKKSDTLYYVYTFAVHDLPDLDDNNPPRYSVGDEITVYLTHLEKTDEWRGTVSYVGHAKIISLKALGIKLTSQSSNYSIDVTTWHYAHNE